jgi:hypothetical protein
VPSRSKGSDGTVVGCTRGCELLLVDPSGRAAPLAGCFAQVACRSRTEMVGVTPADEIFRGDRTTWTRCPARSQTPPSATTAGLGLQPLGRYLAVGRRRMGERPRGAHYDLGVNQEGAAWSCNAEGQVFSKYREIEQHPPSRQLSGERHALRKANECTWIMA